MSTRSQSNAAQSPGKVQLWHADWLVIDADRVLPKAGLLLDQGQVVRVLDSADEVQRASRETGVEPQNFAGILAPGWVNAHAHLELSCFAGGCEPGTDFQAWVRWLMSAKANTSASEWAASVRQGVHRLIATGTTCVGDIDSQGVAAEVLQEGPIRSVVYREALDAHDPERTRAALQTLEAPLGPSEWRTEGISPHAGFTVSLELLRGLTQLAASRSAPMSMHWAETRAEVDWLTTGTGPLAGWLGSSPLASGLELLRKAGALGPALSLVHGNCAQPKEWRELARTGTPLVHCPGSHIYFGREPFVLREALDAGVRVALGTDSAASNQDLNMGREVALLRAQHPWLVAAEAYAMGTSAGAYALGMPGQVGHLGVGAQADAAWFPWDSGTPVASQTAAAVLEFLTTEAPLPRMVWVSGNNVSE